MPKPAVKTLLNLALIGIEALVRGTAADASSIDQRIISKSANWRIERISSGTRVSYSLAAEPKGALPRRMCRGALRKSAASLLGQVRTEMLRRSKLAPRQP